MRPNHSSFVILAMLCGLNSAMAAHADTAYGAAEPAVQDTYPHVTELESYILGQTYIGDSLQTRVGRMEKKAFGAASTDPDLSARTDALTDYADQKLGKKTPVATDNSSYQTSDNSAPSSDETPGNYPHITALEKGILGTAYPQDALPARLARMESKAFGAPSTDVDLCNRTDALDTYVEKKLHKKSFDKQQADQAASEGKVSAAGGAGGGAAGKGKALLNFVGNQLLGMVIPIPGVGQFGGVRMRPASDNRVPQEQAGQPPEDPAIFSPTPPPADAHMITQVGWSEMRVFGHTSPQLHLVERLEQLNGELNYAPKQKGTELMDDVPKLIQIVAARQRLQPQASLNSTAQ